MSQSGGDGSQRRHGVEACTHRLGDAPVPSPLAHDAPDIPGKHLVLVERREVADHVPSDEPGAVEAIARDTAPLRIEDASSHAQPGLAGREEPVTRNVAGRKEILKYARTRSLSSGSSSRHRSPR